MGYNIWGDCPARPLPELLSFIVDNRGKTVPTSDSGRVLIATNCIRNETLYPAYEKIRFLSEETYQTWFRAHPMPGDILFVCKGTPGRVCMVPDPIDFCIAQDMVALRVNSSVLYNRYLLAVLRSRTIQKQIESTSVGDVIPHFKKSFFDQIMIPVPPMEIQRLIGDYYFSFSNKIETNKVITSNLEQMAQAIFKSWFVDFEPFGGMMPDDWREGTLSDIATITMGQSPNGASYNEESIGTVFYQGRAEFGSRFPTRRLFTTQPKRMAEKGDVLMSVRAPVGDLNVAFESCCLGRGLAGIQSNSGCQSFVLYTMFALKQQLEIFNGEGTVFGSINKNDMANLPVLIPSNEVLRQFEELVSPMDATIEANYAESCNLQATRDSLLPRLMSGELSVADH